MDINKYNSQAWDCEVDRGNRWTVPVSREVIAEAREGRFRVLLTPQKPVPMDWLGDMRGRKVLCLAGAGGQQAPIFAAAGAEVTVYDNSPKQLGQDRQVAERESLDIQLVQGDMADLGALNDGAFELIFHPCSNCFAPDIRPVWRECHRVLWTGGTLLSGFANPARYIFDERKATESGILEVRHKLPFAETTDLADDERKYYVDRREPLLFSHTLDAQIGGQLEAGFALVGFYEDYETENPIADFMPTYLATRSVKSLRA
ncbi:MAG: class I SAM-dependent methyltransferase [Planctomycetota bacterium]